MVIGSLASSSRRAAPSMLLALALLAGVACRSSSTPASSPSPTGTPLSLPALKLAVLDGVGGHLAYCDPDLYPIERGRPIEAAQARLPMIEADRPVFEAILQHERLSAGQRFTDDQLIAINDLYKQIQAIDLQPSGDGYRFDVLIPEPGSDVANLRVTGTVSRSGTVTVEKREVGRRLACPICLAGGVRIATPSGQVPIQDVRVGMRVWTTDGQGRRVVGAVLRVGRMQAPLGHEVVGLDLADGRQVSVSPGHPTADGRTVGDLRLGHWFDGSTIVGVGLTPYAGFTYDLLPSGPTGTYFANGILLRSTLAGTGSALARLG
jgi:hypothetical protein